MELEIKRKKNKVEALEADTPRKAEKVSITGSGPIECGHWQFNGV